MLEQKLNFIEWDSVYTNLKEIRTPYYQMALVSTQVHKTRPFS